MQLILLLERTAIHFFMRISINLEQLGSVVWCSRIIFVNLEARVWLEHWLWGSHHLIDSSAVLTLFIRVNIRYINRGDDPTAHGWFVICTTLIHIISFLLQRCHFQVLLKYYNHILKLAFKVKVFIHKELQVLFVEMGRLLSDHSHPCSFLIARKNPIASIAAVSTFSVFLRTFLRQNHRLIRTAHINFRRCSRNTG